ncbi:THA1-like protein [Mya arenaria]|uniref:THA1-like protein n=1 Tax=Mya arenaria TaxID=6604 RepID=A0ABY7DJ94_MYAAR|nr:THA1-like protein [Mya arenaria]
MLMSRLFVPINKCVPLEPPVQTASMSYASPLPVPSNDVINKPRVVDLRSDTLTLPSPGMRRAMAEAEVGDDVYSEDPTVIELQRRCAELFGMEAALLVPTGTMGNLISILVHCRERGQEAVVGDQSHILLNEQAGIAQFAGVCPRTIKNLPDGTFDVDELRRYLRPTNDVYEVAQENNIKVHTDGARILNSAVALGVPVSEILKYSDSVNMCFSKGLAAPVGSIIAGTQDFIKMAVRMRKGLGGGLRQSGIFAAAALYSLEHVLPRLYKDNQWAAQIAEAVSDVCEGVARIPKDGMDTNMVMFEMVKPGLTARDFSNRLIEVTDEERSALGEVAVRIRSVAIYPMVTRLVTHNDLDDEMVAMAIKKIRYVLGELAKS